MAYSDDDLRENLFDADEDSSETREYDPQWAPRYSEWVMV